MKLPNAHRVVIEAEKVRAYCLSETHPRGRHKARVFLAALGLRANDWEELNNALLVAAQSEKAAPGVSDFYGDRYIIDFEMKRGEKAAVVRSCWIIRSGETVPRFVTCFVL